MSVTQSSLVDLNASTKNDFVADAFFATAIQASKLAHAYILKGKNTQALYQLALNVAQVLNCRAPLASGEGKGTGEVAVLERMACGTCVDCRWVASNSHPAVLTVSPLTYQVNDKGELMGLDELEKLTKKGTLSTQIKTDQVGRLIQQLGVSSPQNRVVIFTHAEVLPATFPAQVSSPFDWRAVEANEDKSFHPRPLDLSVFNVYSVNKFLKTLEEPPPRVLFFFLADTEAQLLDTIVSRCQVIPVANVQGIGRGNSALLPDETVAHYLQAACALHDIYARRTEFEALIAQYELTSVQGLTAIQDYCRRQFLRVASVLSETQFFQYRKLQEETRQAIERLEAKVHPEQTLLAWLMTLKAENLNFLAKPTA